MGSCVPRVNIFIQEAAFPPAVHSAVQPQLGSSLAECAAQTAVSCLSLVVDMNE